LDSHPKSWACLIEQVGKPVGLFPCRYHGEVELSDLRDVLVLKVYDSRYYSFLFLPNLGCVKALSKGGRLGFILLAMDNGNVLSDSF
jgi:hypothetical protein